MKRKELKSNKKKKTNVLKSASLNFKDNRVKREENSKNNKDNEKKSSNAKTGLNESSENEKRINESPSKYSVLMKHIHKPLFETNNDSPSSLLKDSLRSFRTQSHEI